LDSPPLSDYSDRRFEFLAADATGVFWLLLRASIENFALPLVLLLVILGLWEVLISPTAGFALLL
jgi:hypothetical protein